MIGSLSLALILAIGWALSYRAKWRRAEQLLTHWRSLSEHQTRCLVAKTEELEAVAEKLVTMTRKRDDAWDRYCDSLDEIAALRDGSAAE